MARKQFHEDMLEDLAILLENSGKLGEIVDFSHCVGVGLNGLGRRIAAQLGLEESLVRDLLSAISRLKRFFEIHDGSAEGLRWISDNIQSRTPADWQKKHLAAWRQYATSIADVIDRISDDHPIVIALKAQTLVYSHQNIFLDAKLITDIRPIFNDAASKIDELVVTHMLSVEFMDGTQQSNSVLTIAMDQDDIASLQAQCERAAIKTLTLRNQLTDFQIVVMPDNSEGTQ